MDGKTFPSVLFEAGMSLRENKGKMEPQPPLLVLNSDLKLRATEALM